MTNTLKQDVSEVLRNEFYAKHAPYMASIIGRLSERLELSPDHDYDGIDSRDETIRLLEARVKELEAQASEPVASGDVFTHPHLNNAAVHYADSLGVADSREHAQVVCAFIRGYERGQQSKEPRA